MKNYHGIDNMIQIDSREKPKAITGIIESFDKHEVKHFVSKLVVGDYMAYDNPRVVIDRKQNLGELCGNVCAGHNRFKSELERANNLGIKLIILCEHGENIKKLEDIKKWSNPRISISSGAITGDKLYKILHTISIRYNVDFVFCNKQETGEKIIGLLTK